jgi:hypothetical protein
VLGAPGGAVAQLDVDGAVVRQRGQIPLGGGPGHANPGGDVGSRILLAGNQGFEHRSFGGRAGPRGRDDVARDQGALGAFHRLLVDGSRLCQDPAVAGIGAQLLREGFGREGLE